MNRSRGPTTARRIQLVRRDYSISDTGYTEATIRPCCVVVDAEAVLMYLLLCIIWGAIIVAIYLAWIQVP